MNIDITADLTPLPPIVQTPGRLTEYEVRVAGLTSTALIHLRTMLGDSAKGGTVQTAGGTMTLNQNDLEAVLALLIERGEQLLTQLDIAIDTPVTALTAIQG